MLKLKYLNGLNSGQVVKLKMGDNFVGRLPECDVCIPSLGISKKHAKITVQNDRCMVVDLGSSNGTFVNGVKVTNRIVKAGDRVAFHDVILEFAQEKIKTKSPILQNQPSSPVSTSAMRHPAATGFTGNLALQQNRAPQQSLAPSAQMRGQEQAAPEGFFGIVNLYFEKVVFPGIYRLTEIYPIKNVMAVFLGVFVLLLTALSGIPMAQMTKQGIQKEAQRRAITICRELQNLSERMIATGNEANIRTDFAENEDGVSMALVVSKDDGHIIAPLAKAQSYSSDEFVARGRKHDETFVQQINDTTIGVSLPIRSFNQEAGQQVTVAFAQVVYKMDSFDWSASIGLFARVLIIALLLGGCLFVILTRMIEQPILEASVQLDQALRGEKDSIKTPFQFEAFQKLIDNVNAAVGRMGQAQSSNGSVTDRGNEASNLVRIVSDAAFALGGNGTFLQVNTVFEELIGMRLLTLQGQSLEILQDQALRLNLEDLIGRSKSQPGTVITGNLDIGGIAYEIDVQASPEGQGIGYIFGTLKRGGFQ